MIDVAISSERRVMYFTNVVQNAELNHITTVREYALTEVCLIAMFLSLLIPD